MADLCEGGNEPPGSLKAICNKQYTSTWSSSMRVVIDLVVVDADHLICHSLNPTFFMFYPGYDVLMAVSLEVAYLFKVSLNKRHGDEEEDENAADDSDSDDPTGDADFGRLAQEHAQHGDAVRPATVACITGEPLSL
ncbi:hypothetical protein ANN_10241 [Periplaneta americana]|uniref:Uncharacterized protein n=1 Tax=Periplaneta americana TaxID=6978 RepID=A0ABQ8TNS3_PERAM|nr:hypothetical protein ANN_10241 [Periplaneta americana]